MTRPTSSATAEKTVVRRRDLGHEGRDATQRRLLAREPLELLARGALLVEEALHPHRERGDARHPPQQPGLLARQAVDSRAGDDERRARRMLERRRRRRARPDAGHLERQPATPGFTASRSATGAAPRG